MKKTISLAALAVAFFALPNMIISQNALEDQYFFDWNAKWRQAWLDGDVAGIKGMLPGGIQLMSSSNYSGQFSSMHVTLGQYVDWVENFYTNQQGRVVGWTPIGLRPENIKVLRSTDGGIAWVVEHYRLTQEGDYGKGLQADTMNIATSYTFQKQDDACRSWPCSTAIIKLTIPATGHRFGDGWTPKTGKGKSSGWKQL